MQHILDGHCRALGRQVQLFQGWLKFDCKCYWHGRWQRRCGLQEEVKKSRCNKSTLFSNQKWGSKEYLHSSLVAREKRVRRSRRRGHAAICHIIFFLWRWNKLHVMLQLTLRKWIQKARTKWENTSAWNACNVYLPVSQALMQVSLVLTLVSVPQLTPSLETVILPLAYKIEWWWKDKTCNIK